MNEIAFTDTLPLLSWLLLALTISFICSLLEAILLSINYSHIETLVNHSARSGRLLKHHKEHIDRSLAAILTLNTVAHTLGAAGVGAEVLNLFGSAWVAAASIIMTLLILIFSEIIPKSLGAGYAKQLAPMAAYAIRYLILLTYPMVVLLERFSRTVSPENGYGAEMTREEVMAAAELGKDHGTLEVREARVIRNLLTLHKIHAEDVMTPSTVVFTVQRDDTVNDVVSEHAPFPFSRIPVQGDSLDDIVGMVLRSHLMEAHTRGDTGLRMEELLLPIHTVSDEISIADLLDEFIQRREHIFLVVDEYGSTEGIITLEDAIETLLGVEIVDESDSVEDMRQLARELWEKRRQERRI